MPRRPVSGAAALLGAGGLVVSLGAGVLAAQWTAAGMDTFYSQPHDRRAKDASMPPDSGPVVEPAVYPVNAPDWPPPVTPAAVERPALPRDDGELRMPAMRSVRADPPPAADPDPPATLTTWVTPSDAGDTAAANRRSRAASETPRPVLPAGFGSGSSDTQTVSDVQFPTSAKD